MKIFLGCDHAGFELKEQVKNWLKGLGYEVYDEGAFSYNETDDYPDFISIVARQVASNPEDHRGLVFGGSGQGEAITANRYPGVRATVYYGGPEEIVLLSRTHNNSNLLSIGARFVEHQPIKNLIKLWLETEFPPEPRHLRRIKKIDQLVKDEVTF